MQFKFDANQEFQIAAVEAVVNLFEGQPNGSLLPSLAPQTRQLQLAGVPARPQFDFAESLAFAAIDNRISLDEAALLQNLHTVQRETGSPVDEELKCIEENAETIAAMPPMPLVSRTRSSARGGSGAEGGAAGRKRIAAVRHCEAAA